MVTRHIHRAKQGFALVCACAVVLAILLPTRYAVTMQGVYIVL